MAVHPPLPVLVSRIGTTTALTAAALTATALAPAVTPKADAAVAVARKALRTAASKKGSPYQWGATGPHRFDCSGLTMYSFRKAGRKLPRTAAQQYNRTHHVRPADRRIGDLVFFHSGSAVYHVGIYAGKNKIWHSPRPGRTVRLEKIWTGGVWYGRVT